MKIIVNTSDNFTVNSEAHSVFLLKDEENSRFKTLNPNVNIITFLYNFLLKKIHL